MLFLRSLRIENQEWRMGILSILNVLFSILVLTACNGEPRAGSEPKAQGPQPTASFGTDHFGDTIRRPARVDRIVSLTPATTEILFALGAGNRMVGRGEYDKWPDAALRCNSPGLARRRSGDRRETLSRVPSVAGHPPPRLSVS